MWNQNHFCVNFLLIYVCGNIFKLHLVSSENFQMKCWNCQFFIIFQAGREGNKKKKENQKLFRFAKTKNIALYSFHQNFRSFLRFVKLFNTHINELLIQPQLCWNLNQAGASRSSSKSAKIRLKLIIHEMILHDKWRATQNPTLFWHFP